MHSFLGRRILLSIGSLLVRLKGFQKLTSVKEASDIFLRSAKPLKLRVSNVILSKASNRVLAENIVAPDDSPRFNRSAVDGYALRAEDTRGASQFRPRAFIISKKRTIRGGEAKQVWTGNPVPEGTDAVVMLENTKEKGNQIEVWTSLTPGENVSKKGEDLRKGEIALKSGTRLKPQHVGLLASMGKAKVNVFSRPKISILVTGSELVEPGSQLVRNQIFNSSGYMLSSMCLELEAEPVQLGIVEDDVQKITDRLRIGIKQSDAIVTTGGTSVGAADLVTEAINKIGKPGIVVHGIAMRPGMPTGLGFIKQKPIVVLSGNPVAAFFGFETFVRPLLTTLLGVGTPESRPLICAKMTRNVATTLGRKTFVRVAISRRGEEYFAIPISVKGSSLLSTLTMANGFVVADENREGLEKAEPVTVHMLGDFGEQG